MMWRYDNNGWSQVPDFWPPEIHDQETALKEAGFRTSPLERWGDSKLPEKAVYVYAHEVNPELWLVSWCPGGDRIHYIEVVGLPALIALCRDLGVITMSKMLTEIAAELDDAIYLVGEKGQQGVDRLLGR
jgi:hypothetical protein